MVLGRYGSSGVDPGVGVVVAPSRLISVRVGSAGIGVAVSVIWLGGGDFA